MNERDIFLAAIEYADPKQRQAFIDRACGENETLRADVQALLEHHLRSNTFPHGPAGGPEIAETIFSEARSKGDSAALDGAKVAFCKYLEPSTRDGWLGRLAHYEVEEILGCGAFGIVAKAFDEKLHRVVAIKMLIPELATTSPPRKRFLREARSAAAVPHENLVGIYAVEDQPIPFLVMEYIAGDTLQARLDQNGPLEVLDVLRIGRQIAAGMAAAHAANLIHRDIKPSNILLSDAPAEKAKLSDFGMARAVDDASMTTSGIVAGTPMYMAPEQARGETLDHRADLFSLGSVLYQMTCGRPPFRAPNTMAVLKRVCEDQQRPIADVLPGAPKWLSTIIERLLEKNRDDRFQNAQEVADLLARCQRELETQGEVSCVGRLLAPTEERPLPKPGATNSSGRRVGLLAIGLLATTALVIGLVVQGNRQQSSPHSANAVEQENTQADVSQPNSGALTNKEYFQTLLDLGADITLMNLGGLLTPEASPAFEKISENTWSLVQADPLGDGQQFVQHQDVFVQFGKEFDDRKLKQLATLLKLRPHDASGVMLRLPCEKLTSKGLSELADVNFVELTLWYVQLDAEGISHLKQCLPSWTLVLNSVGLENDEFVDLMRYVPQGLWIHTTHNQLNDEALDAVQQAAPKVLNVGHNEITDEGLKALYHLKSLEHLQLDGTKVTAEGLAALHQTIPSCTLHWNGEVIEPLLVNGQYQWPNDQPAPAIAPFTPDEARQHQQEWAEHLDVPVEYENSIGMKFRLIPPGEFLMGSSEEEVVEVLRLAREQGHVLSDAFDVRTRRENPQHWVVLTKPVAVGIHEVTRGAFREFVSDAGYVTDAERTGQGGAGYGEAGPPTVSPEFLWNAELGFQSKQTEDHPVVNVSWNDAVAYCEWLSKKEALRYRLLTEAEWEFACRAGTQSRFHVGNAIDRVEESEQITSGRHGPEPVGTNHPNPFGLYDTAGNVKEWCLDSFGTYSEAKAINPLVEFSSPRRILRGGSFGNGWIDARSSHRYSDTHDSARLHYGFRIVRTFEKYEAPRGIH